MAELLIYIFMDLIPIDRQLNGFYNHLSYNDRIIFSAKFGDGKTFFLDEFKKKYNKEYYFITLYPINYSLSENKDIFEYIKRDILFQLGNDGFLSSIDIEAAINSLANWENIKEVLNFLLSFVPQGALLSKLIGKAEQLAIQYNERKTSFGNYNKFFEQQKGGIYENDGYTKLIEITLSYIKEHGKKTVLIIEDLDRIDPAYIFRILNIFSAHVDRKYMSSANTTSSCLNKFCFDKIITVCDYDNVRKIYHHFYGADTSFNGYIKKFSSDKPFRYSITNNARNILFNEKCHFDINNITINDKNMEYEEFIKNIRIKLDSLSIRDIIDIMSSFELRRKKKEEIPYYRSYRLAPINSFSMFLITLKRLDIHVDTAIECFIKCNQYDLINCIGINWGLLNENNTQLGQALFLLPNSQNLLIHKVNICQQSVKNQVYTDAKLDIKNSNCYSEIIKNQLPSDFLRKSIQQVMKILKKYVIL